MSNDPKNHVIQSGIVGNAMLFWCEGNRGYSTNLDIARRFTEEEARIQVEMRPDVDVAWPIDEILKAARFTVSVENIDANLAIRGEPPRSDAEIEDAEPCCCSCGTTKGIDYGPDPYAEGINGDDTPVWLCERCYQESVDNI